MHISKTYQTERNIEEQIIKIDQQGNIIRLKDIAKVTREYPEPDNYITNNGVKCLLLSIEMRENNDITSYGEEVNKIITKFELTLPKDVKISRITDQAKVVDDSVNRFLWEMIIAIASVILVTMILMILAAALSRLIPHPYNFSPICAMALFGSAYLNNRYYCYIIPIASMWISDLLLNNIIYAAYFDHFIWFYDGAIVTYAAFLLISLLGRSILHNKIALLRLFCTSILSSVIFFLISNFGVWLFSSMRVTSRVPSERVNILLPILTTIRRYSSLIARLIKIYYSNTTR